MFRKKKNTDTMSPELIKKLDRTPIKHVTERDSSTAREKRLGENGAINIMGNDFVIVCAGKDVFRAPINEVKVGMMMNLSGLTAVYTDKSNVRHSIIAYFSDGSLGKR